MPEFSFPLTGPIDLHARLGLGTVTVTAREHCDTATVRLTTVHPDNRIIDQIEVGMRGSTLSVSGPRPVAGFGRQRETDAVDAEIEVPQGTAVKVTTMAGHISVLGRCGSADLASGAANIEVDHVDGDLRLRFGAANARVQYVSGDITAKSGSGDVTLGEVGGAVAVTAGSGRLHADTVHGAVRSRTGSGDTYLGAAFSDVDLVAGSGRIEVGLPAGVSARLDVHSGSGRFESDLPVEDSATSRRTVTLRARTGSGGVRVFRAPGAPDGSPEGVDAVA